METLVNNPNLLTYLNEQFIDRDIINKINDNNLMLQDVKFFDKELFKYDVFTDGDKSILDLLRTDVNISDKKYASFKLNTYNSTLESNNYIETTIPSFIDDEELVISKRKAILLENDRISLIDNIDIAVPLDKDKIFVKDIFDFYYDGDISYNKDSILFISYKEFLDWIKDDEKVNILKSIQVVIKDDYMFFSDLINKINWFSYDDYRFKQQNYNDVDELLIKTNHLLYLIQNSELDLEEKEFFIYNITNTFFYSDNTFGKDYIDDFMKELREVTNKIYIKKELKKVTSKIQERLGKDKIYYLTSLFNELNINEKQKNIEKVHFSSKLFLKQFDDLDKMSAFDFLNYFARLKKEEKKEVLSSEIVIKKLQGLLKESANDEYLYYKRFVNFLDIEEIFNIFDSEFIKEYYKKNKYQNEYRLFFTILEKDINKALEYILEDDKYILEFVKDIDKYDFSHLNYTLLLKLLEKIENNNLNCNFYFLKSIKKADQFNLLKEHFSDDFLVKIVENSSNDVQHFFYLEDDRFKYLYNKFNILNLINLGFKFNDEVVNKKDFLDKFKSTSLIQFRININQFSIYQPNIFFEEKVLEYEKELISNYDVNSGLFIQYKNLLDNINLLDDRRFINNGIDFFYDSNLNYELRKFISYDDNDQIYIKNKEGIINYLKMVSTYKLNEVIIDMLFMDNIYNVFLNIKEMLRFNNSLNDEEKVLSQEQVDFYTMFLNIDKLNNKNIIELYDKFKDKNVALMFYEDLQKVKNKSYDKIKNEMFQPEEMVGLEDEDLSLKYGVSVFDLRDKEYVILARCIRNSHHMETHNKRDCYTLLSNENSNVMHEDGFVYGYSGFDNDCVLHMFEGDSYSGDVKWSELSTGSDRVNRIMSSHEIATNSYLYSEVQIVNKKEENGMFESLRPSFLIVYDEINDKLLEEAKKKNIPICIINYTRNRELEGAIPFNESIDRYTNERWSDNEVERRMHR